jgi:hypothetical protein
MEVDDSVVCLVIWIFPDIKKESPRMPGAFQLPNRWFIVIWPNYSLLSFLSATKKPILPRKIETNLLKLLHLQDRAVRV